MLIPEIARIEVCYAPGRGKPDPEDYRRKPETGMLVDAAAALGLDLTRSWMIGDRWRDIDCGHRAGVRTVFIDLGYREELRHQSPHFTVKSIGDRRGYCPCPTTGRCEALLPPMPTLSDLKIQIYADGADTAGILELYAKPYIKGLTTNPSLMNKAGIKDYEAFARDILQTVTAKPISLEVFADEFPEMKRQALKIAGWGPNVYVKIPITNTRAESSVPLIRELTAEGVKLNLTALLTLEQVRAVAAVLNPQVPVVVSLFAGRIADTGVDPMPLMRESRKILAGQPRAELLWASVREVLNILQAEQCGCDIVTVTHDVLAKAAKLLGRDLTDLSLDTVKMFANDAAAAGFKL